MTLAILTVVLVVLIVMGVEVAFALPIVGILYVIMASMPGQVAAFPIHTYEYMRIYELIAIPLYILIGEVLTRGGGIDHLVRFSQSLVGHFRGGLAYVVQVASMLMGGLTGSATGEAAALAPIMCRVMEKEGYPKDLSAAVVATASVKGGIVPPSLMYIMYGVVAGGAALGKIVSIREMYVGGLFCGIVVFLFHAATVYVIVRRRGIVERRKRARFLELLKHTYFALPLLVIVGVVVGWPLAGQGTVEEAASLGVIVAFITGLYLYRGVKWRHLYRVILEAGVLSGSVVIYVGLSSILAYALVMQGVPRQVAEYLQQVTTNPYLFLLMVNVALFLVGIFIEPIPALVIMAPILAPIADQYHIDPVHFGLVVCINLLIGIITPPVGMVLFVTSSITGCRLERLSIAILPFLGMSLLALLLITYLPSEMVLIFARIFGSP